jgi:protein-disulfide isomerase
VPGLERRRALLCLLALLLLPGCSPAGEDVARIREEQGRLAARLARLEAEQRELREDRATGNPGPQGDDGGKVHDIEVEGSPALGRQDAPVTIVEFSDFQCPYCAATAPLLKRVLERYDERVRLVYKHFPLSFHREGRPAALASLAAEEQGGFWEMHDLLFRESANLREGRFAELAREAGLDVERFLLDYEERRAEYEARVIEDYTQGLRLGVRGTPTLFVNGRRVMVRTFEEISAMIDEELRVAPSS